MVSQWTVSQIDGTSLYTIQDSADEEQFASLQGFGVSISELASFYIYLMIVFSRLNHSSSPASPHSNGILKKWRPKHSRSVINIWISC